MTPTADAIIGPGGLIGEVALITETTPAGNGHRSRADQCAAPLPCHVSAYDGGVSAVGAAARRRPSPPCHGDVGGSRTGQDGSTSIRDVSAGPCGNESGSRRSKAEFGRRFVRRPFEGLTRAPPETILRLKPGLSLDARTSSDRGSMLATHPARLGACPGRHRGARARPTPARRISPSSACSATRPASSACRSGCWRARSTTKVVERVGAEHVALITGEEKIKPDQARYWVATVGGDAARHRRALRGARRDPDRRRSRARPCLHRPHPQPPRPGRDAAARRRHDARRSSSG